MQPNEVTVSGGSPGSHGHPGSGTRTPLRSAAVRALAVLLLGIALSGLVSGAARADEYDEKRAGHPLRVVAYVLHPVGVILDRLIFRPAHWLGSHEPLRTLFGHEDD